MAAGAIAGTRTALHGGNAADIASSMGKASAGAAVGGKALSAASATVKFVAGVAGTAAGTAATVKTTQTAAKTIRDKNATTQEKAAAVFDAALSAAGTIGSAALAVKSFPAVKQEIGYYMAKYQCKAKNMSQSVDTTSSPSVQEQSELLTWNEFQHKNKGYATIPNNEQYLVTIQLKVRSAQAGIELKNQVTEALNEKLGWLGLGCVDGFDIDIKKSILGYYNLEIYCVVVDSDKACNEIKKLMPCAVISDYTISVHVNTGSWHWLQLYAGNCSKGGCGMLCFCNESHHFLA